MHYHKIKIIYYNNISYEDNKIDFIKQKDDESSSIKVKEHEHELIYN